MRNLLNRLFDVDSSCAITSSSAVCCVSARDKLRGDLANIGLHQVGLRGGQLGLSLVTALDAACHLGDGVVDRHALLGDVVQRRTQAVVSLTAWAVFTVPLA
jgi:hypothetical protein